SSLERHNWLQTTALRSVVPVDRRTGAFGCRRVAAPDHIRAPDHVAADYGVAATPDNVSSFCRARTPNDIAAPDHVGGESRRWIEYQGRAPGRGIVVRLRRLRASESHARIIQGSPHVDIAGSYGKDVVTTGITGSSFRIGSNP